jgi:HEAT repeat protein
MQGAKSMPLLMEAVKGNDEEYRAAALKFAGPYLNPTTTAAWIQEMKKAQPAEKAAIITMLGNNRVASALPAITLELKSPDEQVKIAAITAAGKIGQDKVLPNLLDIIKTGSTDVIAAVKNALLVMKGSNIPQQIAAALPSMPADAQVALISVLSARAAHPQINAVMPLMNSDSPNVKMAAYSSLKSLAGEDNLPVLFSQLASSTQPETTAEVQAAIINVISHSNNKSALTPMVLSQMQQAPADKKRLYFAILASIGDKQSLAAVTNGFNQGDYATKQAALAALSQWANVSSAKELFKISNESADPTIQDMALQGFVKTISRSDYPADEKLIFLRNAMEIAKTVQQKRMILRQVESCKTFPALIFAGKYLDDAELQADAANDVMSIALSNKAFYGNIVRDLLNKTILSMKGTDSDYLKEAIRKFLAEMPQDAGFVALFNDKDLAGWKGLVADPIKRSKMDAQTLAQEQQKADEIMRKGWYVKDGILNFSGEGENICTTKQYSDFDMYVDWKILSKGDAGIYLRGSPQVQIWDTSRVDVGAQVGSGGLYNNKPHESKPLKLADNAIGEWNSFHIVMKGDKVTVWLNGVLVVDNVVMDNYWDRSLPIFTKEQIELQAHGNHVFYRDIYLRELTEQENITKN